MATVSMNARVSSFLAAIFEAAKPVTEAYAMARSTVANVSNLRTNKTLKDLILDLEVSASNAEMAIAKAQQAIEPQVRDLAEAKRLIADAKANWRETIMNYPETVSLLKQAPYLKTDKAWLALVDDRVEVEVVHDCRQQYRLVAKLEKAIKKPLAEIEDQIFSYKSILDQIKETHRQIKANEIKAGRLEQAANKILMDAGLSAKEAMSTVKDMINGK